MRSNLALREDTPRMDHPAVQMSIPVLETPELTDLLSGREEQIAHLAAQGLSNKEIGRLLGISHWTVATHLRRAFLKLEITKRIGLCRLVSASC